MPHSLDVLWDNVVRVSEQHTRGIIRAINEGEEAYQDLLEMVDGRTDQQVADQLFNGSATQVQLDRYIDAKNAMVAIHQLWQAMSNVAVGQSDRFSVMRRMS